MDAKLIGELIECCGYCINYLISSLQAMENGDIAECQKQSSQAKKLLSSAIGDVFTEVKELAEETDGTFANHGEVEIVRRAVDFISEYNARLRKPVITPRNKFFQLPELAERMRERLKAVQSRENKEVPFEGGTLVWNYGEDRLQILFDRIPEDNRRKELKSSGFRWSPRNKAWQRQLTSNALSAAKRVLNLQNI